MKTNQENLTQQVQALATLIQQHQHVTVLTGAGISVSAGIPDLEMMPGGAAISSETTVEQQPAQFWQSFHQLFLDPIFNNGPTISHRVLAALEKKGDLMGVVTTNVDYLHELAGNRHTANIWSDLNHNHCLSCGRVWGIDSLRPALPKCPTCGGPLSPDPIFRHIATLPAAVEQADAWMAASDLTIVIGCNGYYSRASQQQVVTINPKVNQFDQRATLSIHQPADQVFNALAKTMSLPID